MLKLLKYEWMSKWKLYGIVILLYEMANVALVLKIKSMDPPGISMHNGFVGFVFLLSMALPLLAFVDSVNSLRLESKHSTRDLYFALPRHGLEKIGSKLIFSLVTMAIAGGIALLTALFSAEYLTGMMMLHEIVQEFSQHFGTVSYFFTLLVVGYLELLATIYLSFALFRSFFSQIKFGGMVTFGIFIGISYLTGKISELLVRSNIDLEMELMIRDGGMAVWSAGAWPLAVVGLLFVILYISTGMLYEHRVNFD